MPLPIARWAASEPLIGALHDETRRATPSRSRDRDHDPLPAESSRLSQVGLPPPARLAGDLSTALLGRRSRRALDRDRPITLAALGDLLHWSAGAPRGVNAGVRSRRSYASAGAVYPLELYTVARNVSDLAPGLYHWQPTLHRLERLPGSRRAHEHVYEALRYPWHRDAAALVLISCRFGSLFDAYGPRGYRFGLIEAGQVLQNLGLVAAALGLAGCAIGTDCDSQVEDLLSLTGGEEALITGYAVGMPSDVAEPTAEEITSLKKVSACRSAGSRSFAEATVGIPLDELAALPIWDGGRPPGLAALKASEQVLGLRMLAAAPREWLSVPPEAWPGYGRLVHLKRQGLAVRWARTPRERDEPPSHGFTVKIGDAPAGVGMDFFSPGPAMEKAVGEAVERLAWLDGNTARGVVAAPSSLDGQALALDRIAGYSAALRAEHPGRLRWTPETPFMWIAGRSLTLDAPRWIPLQLVCGQRLGQHPGCDAREPELRPRVTTGIAAHPDRTLAILNGLLEVVERDAFMLTWLRQLPTRPLDLETAVDPRIREVASKLADTNLDAHAVQLMTDVPVPVVLGIVSDPTGIGPAFGFGAAAASAVPEAVVSAVTEAFRTWRAVHRARHRGERAPDDPSWLDRHNRLLWWADPERAKAIRWLVDGAKVEIPPSESSSSAAAELARLIAWFRDAGEEVIVVDLTDETAVLRLGHHVAGVVVPGFHPLHLREDRPARWSRRLESVPAALGLPAAPELNSLPHPFL